MKKIFSIAVLCLLFALPSCTKSDKLVTKDGQVIDISKIKSINKEDSTGNNSDGGTEPDLEEE